MPIHSFTDEASGETIDVYVAASAPSEQHQQQKRDGKVYRRVYSAPLAARDTGFGSSTEEDFTRKTSNKAGLKVGDMWEISAEMSDRRKQRDGVDTVREDFYAKYEQSHGEKHADVVRREKLDSTNARLKEWGIKVEI